MNVRIALALVLPLLAAPALAESKAVPEREVWYAFNFYGNKVGWLKAKDEQTEVNGQPAVHLHRWSVVTVKRQENTIRMESTTDTWFAPDGTPMRFKHSRTEGREKRSIDGYRDGKQFVVARTVGGDRREERIPLSKNVKLASSLEILFTQDGLKVGKTMKGRAIDEQEAQVQPFSLKVTGKEGEDFVVEQSLGAVKSRLLMAPDGRVKKTEILGIGAEFVEMSQEEATKVAGTVDIFRSALFKIPEPLPSGDELESLVVRVKGRSGKRPTYISDRRQRAKKEGKDGVRLAISVDPAPKKRHHLPIRGKKRFLKATPYEALSDERLVKTAKDVVGDEKDVFKAAKRINAFVYKHIGNKSLARAFASATEALESKEGDCTEHAVLFSALAKIVGIPTRLATGLVYVGGPENVFGYHEWVEIWTGSEWLAMDPTFGQDIADPTHIKFAQGQSDPDGLREAGMVAAALIGDLELEVLSYTTVSGQKKTL